VHKFRIRERIDEKDARAIAELRGDGGSDCRIWVNGQDGAEVWKFLGESEDRGANLFERCAEIFAAVRGDQKKFARELCEARIGKLHRHGVDVV
jgi:hypothetical protein